MINEKIFDKELHRPKVLVAPLDWGLGHATRCIPIINELLKQNCEVILAADHGPFFLLKKEFPAAVFLRINSYRVAYSRNKKWLPFKLLLQLPGIAIAIWKENTWIKKVIREHNINAVISDNRFGIYNKKIQSVYITHQLHIKTGNAVSEKIAQKIHHHFIKKYNHCWVPDYKQNGLAGELSHPVNIPSNVTYIGPLSRFKKNKNRQHEYDVLISLSGPEPQRSIFEQVVVNQLKNFKKKVLLVRGLPHEKEQLQGEGNLTEIVNHLSAEDLNTAFQQAEMIICRSGYSTIMDLVKLGKKAILVPTPGQTEQEYLSAYLMEKKYFYSVPQNNFSLEKLIEQASSFPFIRPDISFDNYIKVVNEFVLSLKTGNFATQ